MEAAGLDAPPEEIDALFEHFDPENKGSFDYVDPARPARPEPNPVPDPNSIYGRTPLYYNEGEKCVPVYIYAGGTTLDAYKVRVRVRVRVRVSPNPNPNPNPNLQGAQAAGRDRPDPRRARGAHAPLPRPAHGRPPLRAAAARPRARAALRGGHLRREQLRRALAARRRRQRALLNRCRAKSSAIGPSPSARRLSAGFSQRQIVLQAANGRLGQPWPIRPSVRAAPIPTPLLPRCRADCRPSARPLRRRRLLALLARPRGRGAMARAALRDGRLRRRALPPL